MHDSGLDPGWRDDFSVEDTMGATGEILVWLLCNKYYCINGEFFEFDN